MVQLTPEQAQELKQQIPPKIVVGDKEFVLVQSDAYEKLRRYLEPEEIDESLYEAEDLG